ncbi:MAG: hypothetical protein H6604_00660 [Flavobacteriales bacterium]|nr:hypothetical protein [Flavobacteriales bacterium]
MKKVILILVTCAFVMNINAQEKQENDSVSIVEVKASKRKMTKQERRDEWYENMRGKSDSFDQKVKKFVDKSETLINSYKDSMKMEIGIAEEKLKKQELSDAEFDSIKMKLSEKYATKINENVAQIEGDFSELLQQKINKTVRKSFYEKTEEERLRELKNQYRYVPWWNLNYYVGFSNFVDEFNLGSISDSPLRFSSSLEHTFEFKHTRRMNDFTSPFIYSFGLGVMFRDLHLGDNLEFTKNANNELSVATSPFNLDKSKMRLTYLTIPLELEYDFGKKNTKENLLDYKEVGKLRLAFGLYGGLKIGEMRKLKYDDSGNSITSKNRGDYGFNDFIFGGKLALKYNNWEVFVKKDFTDFHNSENFGNQGITFGIKLTNFISGGNWKKDKY